MKTCVICSYRTLRDEATCPCCGEASWFESPPPAPAPPKTKGKR